MPRYAMLSNNTVENIIVADDKEATEKMLNCKLIEITPENPIGVGWVYNPETGTFPALETREESTTEQL